MIEPVPEADRVWLQNNKQVFIGEKDRWMTFARLKKEVIAGHADDWWVVDIDFATGEKSLICPYCATGVDHRGTFH
jgi:hypothetical protein